MQVEGGSIIIEDAEPGVRIDRSVYCCYFEIVGIVYCSCQIDLSEPLECYVKQVLGLRPELVIIVIGIRDFPVPTRLIRF